MDRRDVTDSTLRDLAGQVRAGRLSRRELIEGAGVLVGGTALASFLATCGLAAPAAAAAPGSQSATGG